MRKLVFVLAALLFGAPAPAFELSTERFVIPVSVACETLEQMRTIIRAAQRGGRQASDEEYRRINAQSKPEHRACITVFGPDPKFHQMRLVEGYAAVETIPGFLRDVLVMEMVDLEGKTRYIAIERELGRGYTL